MDEPARVDADTDDGPVGDGPNAALPAADGRSTVLRMAVGGQLRRRREAAGISRELAANVIRGSAAKISRLELGRVRFKERDLQDLLTVYGVHDPNERAEYLALARRANAPGWWHQYSDLLPPWFEAYLGMEQAATLIRTFEIQFVPGLLQIPEYGRAVIRLAHDDPAEVERRVALRARRQEVLTVPGAPTLWAVIDESALRRPLGDPAMSRAQIAHLIELDALPNVSLQIASFDRGGLPATGGPFTVLRFAAPDLPDIVYLEQLNSALYIDKQTDVDGYTAVWNRLCAQIEPPERTAAMLDAIRTDLR